MSKEKERTKRITITVTEEQHKTIKRHAGARGETFQTFVFNCITEGCRKPIEEIPELKE